MMVKICFWFSLIFILYTYVFYPIIICSISFFRQKKVVKKDIRPTVSLVIIAYNEAKVIGNKIENCLKLDYPKAKIEIIVVSSGATDNTDNIVKSYKKDRVKSIRIEKNLGKSYALNLIVPTLQSSIIVFSDARQYYSSNAIKEIVANFNDDSIGAVSGELMLNGKNGKNEIKGISNYWNYEKLIRRAEGRINSTIGATGAIYGIRRELFEKIPNDTILDDFVIPMNIVKKGYRVIFEKNAKATDFVAETLRIEFKRKVRTIGGNYQAIHRMPFLINYKDNPVFLQFISHKLFRLLVPYFLVFLIISNLFIESWGYNLFLAAQIVFYLFSFLGLFYSKTKIGFLGTFVAYNIAAIVGLYKFLTGNLKASWK